MSSYTIMLEMFEVLVLGIELTGLETIQVEEMTEAAKRKQYRDKQTNANRMTM